jgi:CheY-like chemotaxis protein
LFYNILIVDDDPDDTFITIRALKKSGIKLNIKTAEDGTTAFKILQEKSPPVAAIILDLKMSGQDGIDVLRQIKSDEKFKNLITIIVTNSILKADEEDSFSAGADAFVLKDFDISIFTDNLKSTLIRLLSKRRN